MREEIKIYGRDEVAKHNTEASAWLIIDNAIYDITQFAIMHPGGQLLILKYAGSDCTSQFYSLHRQEILGKYAHLKIGELDEQPRIHMALPGDISRVPYAEASAMQGFHSPYYKESHHRFRVAVRTFLQTEILPEATVNDEAGLPASDNTFLKLGAFGLLACRMGPGPHLSDYKLPGGVSHHEFDYFHEQITHEEIAILGLPGYQDSIGTGMVIGLPPVMHFATPSLKKIVVDQVLSGAKKICLAVSEPGAGSDVAAIQTTAIKSSTGTHYIVNGSKKWITNGTFCDYFATAVVTDPQSTTNGISMLLIERSEGVETRGIKTSYSSSAGTSYIIFENVYVPIENLLGEEGNGFQVMMYNFNHERWYITAVVNAQSRKVIEECFKWSNQRQVSSPNQVFGKSLLEQPVIRSKLATMITQVEATNSWLESMTYQMTLMSYTNASIKLGGPIALLKLLSTRVAHAVSDDACQIFGGRAITKGGMGRFIEVFQRTYKFGAILGGSEEIMADLGIRQAMVFYF